MNQNISTPVSQESSTVRPPSAAGRTDWINSYSSKETSNASEQSEIVSVSNYVDQGHKKRKASTGKENPRKRQRTSESLEDLSRTGQLEFPLLNDNKGSRKRQRVRELEERCEETIKSAVEAPKKRKKANSATFGGTSSQEFEAKYEQLSPLGSGSFGSVYAGYRREDRFPVAIKHIPRCNVICEGITKKGKTLPLEVAIMLKVTRGQEFGKSAAISLLDFYDLEQELILILERPVPAVDLVDHIEIKGGALEEEESRLLLMQLVQAALELQSKKVFHRDIKAENILIDCSGDGTRVRVIDFGLSCFAKKSDTFELFYGTPVIAPPEWDQSSTYKPGPSTVWQIGVVLFDMLHSEDRFETSSYLDKDISISKDLSPECQEVLSLLLAEDPDKRPSLRQLSRLPWLS